MKAYVVFGLTLAAFDFFAKGAYSVAKGDLGMALASGLTCIIWTSIAVVLAMRYEVTKK